jgi:hypothetical protein
MSEPTPKYLKEGYEVRHAGGLLVGGDLVPVGLVELVHPDALTDEAPAVPEESPDEEPSDATGGTGDAPKEPFELEGE